MFKFEEKDLLPYASIEDIYKYCDHYDLFRHYIGNFTLGRPILSPLREENIPSFAVFVKGNTVLFNDFLLGGGDIIRFVQMRFNLSLKEAINKIVHDSGLTDKFRSDNNYKITPIIKYNRKLEQVKSTINVKKRKWQSYDIEFWGDFGIKKEILSKYRVYPISHIFINSKIIIADKYAYCFIEMKDNEPTFTIYQPFSTNNKWFKSHDHSVFYGWSQLPDKSESLIITKSLKDVMTIVSILDIPSVALQSEKVKPKEHIIEQLKNRFNTIYLFYDNDYKNESIGKINYGREFGKEIANEFNLIQIEIPDSKANLYNAKDISDLAKNVGVEQTKIIFNNDIIGNISPSFSS